MIRTTRRAVRGTGAALVALVLVATLGACSGDDSDPAPEGTGSTTEQAEPSVPTKASIEKVTGRLARDRRAKLRRQVTTTFDAWVDAAYLGEGGAGKAFAVFDKGTARLARRDQALLSNARLRDRFGTVTAKDRKLRIDVLAHKGRPVGVTGRFVLVLELEGEEATRTDRIVGRLLMGWAPKGWRVFGYDVKRGRVA